MSLQQINLPRTPRTNIISNQLKDMGSGVSKALMVGALNSIAIPLLFGGSDYTHLKIPFIQSSPELPDMAVFAGAGFLGQIASDITHDKIYPMMSRSAKTDNIQSLVASLAAYNAVQLVVVGYMGGVTDGRLWQYCGLSSGVHLAGEKIFHSLFGM